MIINIICFLLFIITLFVIGLIIDKPIISKYKRYKINGKYYYTVVK
jgi:hypothetical protein